MQCTHIGDTSADQSPVSGTHCTVTTDPRAQSTQATLTTDQVLTRAGVNTLTHLCMDHSITQRLDTVEEVVTVMLMMISSVVTGSCCQGSPPLSETLSVDSEQL